MQHVGISFNMKYITLSVFWDFDPAALLLIHLYPTFKLYICSQETTNKPSTKMTRILLLLHFHMGWIQYFLSIKPSFDAVILAKRNGWMQHVGSKSLEPAHDLQRIKAALSPWYQCLWKVAPLLNSVPDYKSLFMSYYHLNRFTWNQAYLICIAYLGSISLSCWYLAKRYHLLIFLFSFIDISIQ